MGGRRKTFEVTVEETVEKVYRIVATDERDARLNYEDGVVGEERQVDSNVTWVEEK
jgi:hypothetical protein